MSYPSILYNMTGYFEVNCCKEEIDSIRKCPILDELRFGRGIQVKVRHNTEFTMHLYPLAALSTKCISISHKPNVQTAETIYMPKYFI